MAELPLTLAVINTTASVVMVFIVLFGITFIKGLLFKSETLYGQEAKDRYMAIRHKLPSNFLFTCAPYEGGNVITPQFTVDRFRYDAQTMPPKWKGVTKIVCYYYEENGRIMVKSWRLR